MKGKNAWSRSSLSIIGSLMLVWIGLLGKPARGQSDSSGGRWTIALFAGVARPTDNATRELYGSPESPVSIESKIGVHGQVFAFAGYGFTSRSGRTLAMAPGATTESDPLKLKMHLLKFGGLYVLGVRKLTILAGGGGAWMRFRETWQAADLTVSSGKAGILVHAGLEYPLRGRLSLGGRLEYTHIPVKTESNFENDVNLGRLEFSIGLVFRLMQD